MKDTKTVELTVLFVPSASKEGPGLYRTIGGRHLSYATKTPTYNEMLSKVEALAISGDTYLDHEFQGMSEVNYINYNRILSGKDAGMLNEYMIRRMNPTLSLEELKNYKCVFISSEDLNQKQFDGMLTGPTRLKFALTESGYCTCGYPKTDHKYRHIYQEKWVFKKVDGYINYISKIEAPTENPTEHKSHSEHKIHNEHKSHNRPFLFRAFDPVKNEFAFTNYHFLGTETILPLIENYTLENAVKLKVTQYSGVDDANGTKIYEGDIVQKKTFNMAYEEGVTTNEPVYIYTNHVVEFKNGKFKASKKNYHAWDRKDKIKLSKTVVVGNIYENPNL
jgi:uncharacterized phage protein (TIGR01671 family)